MKVFDILLKASPLIFSCISLVFIITLFIRVIMRKGSTISIDYKKVMVLWLCVLLIIITSSYIYLELNWLENEIGNVLGNQDKFWNLNETLNAIFNILAISKLYIAMSENKKMCIIEKKENKGNNLVVEILTKIDDTKMKHIFYFIAFIVVAIIFFVLALLGKQEAFNVLQPAANLIK